jgi:hypothetical protein
MGLGGGGVEQFIYCNHTCWYSLTNPISLGLPGLKNITEKSFATLPVNVHVMQEQFTFWDLHLF